jgi:translocation and assembly module TamA
MQNLCKILLIFFCNFFPLWANAQHFTLKFYTKNSQDSVTIAQVGYQKSHKDSVQIQKYVQKYIQNLQAKGYLASSVDSIFYNNQNANVLLFVGNTYQIAALSFANIPKNLATITQKASKKLQKKTFYYIDFLELKSKILQASENTGYPFAKVFLDSIQLHKTLDSNSQNNFHNNSQNNSQNISAILRYEQGTYIRFDSLLLVGQNPVKMKKNFLTNYLKLSENQAFSQEKIDNAEKRLRKLPYFRLTKSIETTFERDRAYLILHTEALKINQFDGIVGLLPNAAQNNSLQFTGQINLKLYNLFQSGKTLLFEWQSPKAQSQLLQISYEHLNFLHSSIDITTNLQLNKRDTSFLNFRWSLQTAYSLGGNSKVFVFTEYLQSTSDSTQINKPDKSIADTKIQSYGLGYEFQHIDVLQAPRKGWYFRLAISAGNKEIKPQWESKDSIYQTLQLQSTQIQATSNCYKYFSIGKQSTLLLRTNMGILFNNRLFINELFQLGGIRSLRGFNEMTFFSPSYCINTAEYRLYFEQNSSIFAFVDYALLGVKAGANTTLETPIGLGGGLSFATKAGIFSFVLAMGKSTSQSFGINQTKIHFGLVTRF